MMHMQKRDAQLHSHSFLREQKFHWKTISVLHLHPFGAHGLYKLIIVVEGNSKKKNNR